MARIGARHGVSARQIALAWLLQHLRCILPIPGTASLEHLEENVASAAIRLSEEEYTALSAIQF